MTAFPALPPEAPDELRTAVRRFELGLYHNALDLLLKVLAQSPTDAVAAHYLRLVNRRLARRDPKARPTLIWQFPPDGAWETDWLRFLLADAIGDEIVDNTWSRVVDPMIVVDNRLVPEKAAYYRTAVAQGCRVILIHLSDEAFKDDHSSYASADLVLRNYWSEVTCADAGVIAFPLGYKAGFAVPDRRAKPTAARAYLWAFAGDGAKVSRGEMMKEMGKLPRGFTHFTSGFGAADALPTARYRALLDDAAFAPCPGGWSNLETFRTYEALEAGCIPIVERRPGFDYYTRLLGAHPLPTVADWREGVDLIRRLEATGETERVRTECAVWWASYKTRLKADVGARIAAALR